MKCFVLVFFSVSVFMFIFVLFCLFFCGRYSVIIQPGDGSQQNSPTKGDTSTSRVDSGESNDEKIVLYLGWNVALPSCANIVSGAKPLPLSSSISVDRHAFLRVTIYNITFCQQTVFYLREKHVFWPHRVSKRLLLVFNWILNLLITLTCSRCQGIDEIVWILSLGVTCVVGPLKGNMPKFYMKPVTEFGDAVVGQEGNRLSDEGTLNCLRKSVGTWKNSGFPTYCQTLDLLILCSARITHTSMSS